MTKQRMTVLLASLEVILLMFVTLLIAILWPGVLKPLVDFLCALSIDDLPPIYVIFISFVLVGVWLLILRIWRPGYIYLKVALSYVVFFLCAFILFLRFIVPYLIGPF
jgi:hypothetical protein